MKGCIVKLKLTRDGHPAVKDGMPIYLMDDGSEQAFDAPAAMKLVRGQAFAASKYVADRLSIHPEMAASAFGSAFRIEAGKLVAYSPGGVPLYSHKRPGELANVDEAIEQLVSGYAHKDQILRPPSNTATSAPASAGQAKATISRKQFDGLPPLDRAAHVRAGGTVVD